MISNIKKYNYIQKKKLNNKIFKNINSKFKSICHETIKEIDDPRKTLNVLSQNFNLNFDIRDLMKFKNFKDIVVIGMGGSILGSEAIYSFLKKKIKKNFYFFENLDQEKVEEFKKKNNLNKTLFLIISKSGNTIETISNFFILNIIKRGKKNIIIISEKGDNTLFSLAKKYNLFHIAHKKKIGGRYSVLSEVGLVPAYLMGINIFKLRENLLIYLKSQEKNFLKESSIKLSTFLIQKKFNNLIFLNYAPKLEKFLYWAQQLVAESLGKKNLGFLPVISNTPKDHHSLLQLYLDGPKDKIFHIFSVDERYRKKINTKKFSNKINFLHKKDLAKIKISQKKALIKSFKRNSIPFREFKIKDYSEKSLAELFSYFILETIIIGRLIGINPFDQPAVEQVKLDTKKILN